MLFFLLFVAIATTCFQVNNAQANTDLDSALENAPDSVEDFADWFENDSPYEKNNLEIWDYIITLYNPESVVDFQIIFFSADGCFISGDGSTLAMCVPAWSENGVSAYSYSHFSSGGYSMGSPVSVSISTLVGSVFTLSPVEIYQSSMNFVYLEECGSNWQTSNAGSENWLCGVYDNQCTAITPSSSACSSISPPATITSCTASFSEVPSIFDDFSGFLTGLWSAVWNWFNCAFGVLISSFTSLINGIVSSIGALLDTMVSSISSMLQVAFVPDSEFMNTQLSSLSSEFTTQFADIFTFYDSIKDANADTFDDRFSGTLSYDGHNIPFNLNPLDNVPSFVPIITSFVAYLSLAFFLIHKIPEMFSA